MSGASQVLLDRIVVRITSNPGGTSRDRTIAFIVESRVCRQNVRDQLGTRAMTPRRESGPRPHHRDNTTETDYDCALGEPGSLVGVMYSSHQGKTGIQGVQLSGASNGRCTRRLLRLTIRGFSPT
jgi:hypothetical protein